jgi:hypothetical protein
MSMQFITDEYGKRTAVVLPIATYDKMMDDLDDVICLQMVEQHRSEQKEGDEEAIPFEQAMAEIEAQWAAEEQAAAQKKQKKQQTNKMLVVNQASPAASPSSSVASTSNKTHGSVQNNNSAQRTKATQKTR